MTEKKITINLHSNQLKVWEDSSRFRVLVAGRRFGKTTLAISELIIAAISNNNALFWYVAPTYRQAKMIAWRMLKNMCFEKKLEVKFNEAELSVMFSNGTLIELRGADNEDSLRGTGLWGIVVDEYASIYNNWAVWNEVLRPALTDKEGWALFIGTPKGKDSFFELFMKGQRQENNFKAWQFKTIDNLSLDLEEEVAQARSSMPARYFRQEYEASFEDYVGLIYPEFNKSHIIEPIHIPEIYSKRGAIDPALSGTTGALKTAIDEDGNIIVYDEYYEQNKRASEVAEAIKEEKVKWFLPPDAYRKNIQKEGKLYSFDDEYSDAGIRGFIAEASVEAGINRVGEYFKQGKIKIFSTCKNLIYELERYHWREEKETVSGVMKPEPYKKDDHLVDALRYIIMSRVKKTDITQPEHIPYDSPLAELRRYRREKQTGGVYNHEYR